MANHQRSFLEKRDRKRNKDFFFFVFIIYLIGDKYMKQIDPSKYNDIINRNNKVKKNDCGKLKKYFINLIVRTLIVSTILISFGIIYKSNSSLKDNISNYFFDEGISFSKINKIYDRYLGGILPIKKDGTVSEVFNEKLNYNDLSIYYDGVKLFVSDNYLVPNIDEGMIVFVGEKENYGKTIIVENLDGIYFWYGNITNTSLKLYDYVEKGSFIGEANNYLYLVFSKDGKYLNYEEYIY